MHTRMDALACRMHVGEAIGRRPYDQSRGLYLILALVLVSKAYL